MRDALFSSMGARTGVLAVAIALAPAVCRAASVPCDDDPGHVHIRLTQQADTVLAEYRFDHPVRCVAFGDGTPGAAQWPLRAGADVVARDDAGVRFARPVAGLRLTLTPALRDGALNRVYTPVIPFGDGAAVAVYADAILAARWKAATEVRFAGYLPTAPGDAVGEQVYAGGSKPAYLVVGKPELTKVGPLHVLADRALPRALRERVLNEMAQASRRVADVYPVPPTLTYLMTYSAPAAAGAEWRGDTLPGLVRLNFMGRQWADGRAGVEDVARFVHHETFHTVNWNVADGSQATFLLEGGADAAAAAMTLGAASDAMRERADAALRDCANLPGERLADKAAANPRWAPYRCGEAIQYLAGAAGAEGGVRFDVLPLWSRLLHGAAGRAYDWNDFVAAMPAGAAAGQAGALVRQLVAGGLAWNDALARFAALGVLAPLDGDALHGAAVSRLYAQNALGVLLDAHCTGRRGTLYLDRTYVLDAPPESCRELPDKFPVTTIGNADLEIHGHEAYEQVAAACRAGATVTLGDAAGATFQAACRAPVAPLAFYRFRVRAG